MQFFSLYAAFQLCPCLGNLFIMAIIFSLEEGELGKKRHIRIGIMSNFVKGKRCYWREWKETLQGKIHLLLAIQWAAEDGETHLSPVLAAIPAAPGLLLCSSLRHRHRTAWKPAFGRWHWGTLTCLLSKLMKTESSWVRAAPKQFHWLQGHLVQDCSNAQSQSGCWEMC